MQVASDLRPMFSYSLWPIIICIIIIIVLIILIKLKAFKRKKKELPIIVKKANIYEIKNKYLKLIDNLEEDVNNNKINNRLAYQKLSSLIRNYIYEATGLKVQNYTLKDIEAINMPVLYELVSEYYDPEFSVISKGNILNSITKTRKVIEKWN